MPTVEGHWSISRIISGAINTANHTSGPAPYTKPLKAAVWNTLIPLLMDESFKPCVILHKHTHTQAQLGPQIPINNSSLWSPACMFRPHCLVYSRVAEVNIQTLLSCSQYCDRNTLLSSSWGNAMVQPWMPLRGNNSNDWLLLRRSTCTLCMCTDDSFYIC